MYAVHRWPWRQGYCSGFTDVLPCCSREVTDVLPCFECRRLLCQENVLDSCQRCLPPVCFHCLTGSHVCQGVSRLFEHTELRCSYCNHPQHIDIWHCCQICTKPQCHNNRCASEISTCHGTCGRDLCRTCGPMRWYWSWHSTPQSLIGRAPDMIPTPHANFARRWRLSQRNVCDECWRAIVTRFPRIASTHLAAEH